ncbi:hypothetical protein [Tepidimonas aquatica]|uniref:hypothetical protein n=1 Tax=Tepidimonas aquatica TaxID=247482 RepID=UPI00163DD349|nr:hypothetical protein [Tepidimonas aquatica]
MLVTDCNNLAKALGSAAAMCCATTQLKWGSRGIAATSSRSGSNPPADAPSRATKRGARVRFTVAVLLRPL